jgi:hypothetical protein
MEPAFVRIRSAMAARLRQVLEESEKEDWSKQATAEIERALCRLNFPDGPQIGADRFDILPNMQGNTYRLRPLLFTLVSKSGTL